MDTFAFGLLGMMVLWLLVGASLGTCACWLWYVQADRTQEMHRRAKEHAMLNQEFDMLHQRLSDLQGVLQHIHKQLAESIPNGGQIE